jgi:glutamate-1-semialdehyde 2,1-aminomutase
MAAGAAQLKVCLEKGFYELLEKRTRHVVAEVLSHCEEHGHRVKMFSVGSIFWLAFSNRPSIRAAAEIDPESMKLFRTFYHALLNEGIYIGPSGYEVGFISSVHSDADLEHIIQGICNALDTALA